MGIPRRPYEYGSGIVGRKNKNSSGSQNSETFLQKSRALLVWNDVVDAVEGHDHGVERCIGVVQPLGVHHRNRFDMIEVLLPDPLAGAAFLITKPFNLDVFQSKLAEVVS